LIDFEIHQAIVIHRIMDYLSKKIDLTDPKLVPIIDELSLWSSYFTKLILDNIELKPDLRILDLGFGTGVPLFELAQRMGDSCQFVGLDSWSAAIEHAKWKQSIYGLKNLEIVEGDGAKMPFENDSFDLVVSNLGVNNFEDPETSIQECFRVLKKGGKLILTTNLVGHFQEFYSVFESVLRDLKRRDLIKKMKEQESHRGTVESVRDLFENNDFSILKIIKDKFQWRYLNGTAFLNHNSVIISWLDGWRSILEGEDEAVIFSKIEEKLNAEATWNGELRMSVPMLYVEGIK
jgi:arsenite methyltransferase